MKTPSLPPVRGRLVSFPLAFLPQGRSLYLASPLQGDKRGSYSSFFILHSSFNNRADAVLNGDV